MQDTAATGPLSGLRVLEFSAIGPVPLAAMLLADMGADVVRLTRPGTVNEDPREIVGRGRRWIELDLKDADHKAEARRLAGASEVLLEGFRPGVMERLGLGPDVLLADNPRLVYARMTGWGQEGPLAPRAGHDINYIAITGALDAIRGRDGFPVPPLNIVGDYAGGAMFLAMGVLAAVVEARASGKGQVVDVAMCDGVVELLSMFHAWAGLGRWSGTPGHNVLDGGAHYYGAYRCADGRYVSVGAIEPQFYAELRQVAGLEDAAFDGQNDRAAWPDLRARMDEIFARRTQAEWIAAFEGSDACFAPVISLAEAPGHPHLQARQCFMDHQGVTQAAPAPRFSRTPSAIQDRPMGLRATPEEVVAGWRKAP